MNIARAAINRPVTVWMRIAAFVLLGAVCVLRLPVDLLPKVTIPIVAVVTSWPNVAPEEIETQVTRPIEEAVSAVNNLYQIQSTTVEGNSMVRIEFTWGTDIGQAAVDVLQLVERARQNFPSDPTLQTPVVFKFDPSQLPILIYGVTGEKNPIKLREEMDNQITPMVEAANGVASAIATGGEERAIIVDVNPIKMAAMGISLNTVTQRIAQENINLPAGIAKESNTEYVIRSLGWLTSPKDLASIPLSTFNGHVVTLGDVATVKDSHAEDRIYTRFNGKPAAGLIVTKQSAANTVACTQAVAAKLKQVEKIYPKLKFGLAYDQASYIQNSIKDVELSAAIGGFLAIFILLFFLRNVRSTLVVGLSIPISVISTFALLYLAGFSLNTMTLSGLALSTGLIVDDAVVVLENIFRHMERDKKGPVQAAIDGTGEIISAVFASTWTIMIVFLPLIFIKGQAGQMFTSFAVVVIFALGLSLLDASTLVPVLATRLISGEAHAEAMGTDREHKSLLQRLFLRFGKWFDALDQTYRRALAWALHHRLMTVGGAVAITMCSLLLVPMIGVEMMPEADSGDFSITVKLPIGTALSVTDATMRKVERMLLADPNVATIFVASGSNLTFRGTSTELIPFQGSVTVHLKDNRKESTLMVMNELRRKLSSLPGVRPLIRQRDIVSLLLTGGFNTVEVDIFGQDLSTLSKLAKEVMKRTHNIPGYENQDVNWEEAMPEIQWRVDRAKANRLGLSFADIANTINTATNGTIASYYNEGGFQYPIIVQQPQATRKTIAEMKNMVIFPSSPSSQATASGVAGAPHGVLLSQVATPVVSTGPSEITRQDRQRYIAVQGMPQGRSSGEIQKDIARALKGFKMPTGYYWDWGTNQKRRAQEFAGLGLALFMAIALIYMLLASQFNHFLHPLTILLSVPLAVTGVCLALFLTGRAFGLTAFVGLLLLVGIVVKNGILLVDYTNLLRREGMDREAAILRAGPTRLRPILMTASAAILGMLPIASGLGKGSEIQAPMATAVVGGLITSTLLTLLVVPCVYSGLDDIVNILHARRKR